MGVLYQLSYDGNKTAKKVRSQDHGLSMTLARECDGTQDLLCGTSKWEQSLQRSWRKQNSKLALQNPAFKA